MDTSEKTLSKLANNKFSENNYRILLDKKWSLQDFNNFTRLYMQNYAFIYCLEKNHDNKRAPSLHHILNDYKLRDGLTYVNVYALFNRHIPVHEQPKVRAISYASPGFLELILNYEVAIKIAVGIGVFLKGLTSTAETYNKLHAIFIDLNKRRLEKQNHLLKLEVEQLDQVQNLNEKLAIGLGFQSLSDMYHKVGNEEAAAKLLMAHYRRMKGVAKFVKAGKIKLPEE